MVRCGECGVALKKGSSPVRCECGVYYCSNRCSGKDAKRHRIYCANSIGLGESFYLRAHGLHVNCCAIFPNPAQAYAYALLHRLQCPFDLSSIMIDNSKMLFKLLQKARFDVEIYMHGVTLLVGKDPVRDVWRVPPEIPNSFRTLEFPILMDMVENKGVSPENACLAHMLIGMRGRMTRKEMMQEIRVPIVELMTHYNPSARNPLAALFQLVF